MDIPIYETDPIVRRAAALQSTADATVAMVHIDLKDLTSLGLSAGDKVRVSGQDGRVILPLKVDHRVPAGAVYIPGGCSETAPLGSSSHVTIEAEV
jgi:NADH-quinone oxidoreductase subunit G